VRELNKNKQLKTMEKFNQLLEILNGLKITQHSGDWAENLPEEIWNQHFENNFKDIEHGLDICTHRWYETSTSVVSIYGGFLGINYITNMFSEAQTYRDCYHTITFHKMEEITVTSYKISGSKL
jgi:hypothetical protein